MTYVVALTGGIGAGKSIASNFFASKEVPIIDTDVIAHQLVKPDTACFKEIIAHFGGSLLTPHKTLDRAKLRNIIFNNQNEKQWLENLLHPLIRSEALRQLQTIDSPYCIVVIPLLAEKYGDYQDIIDHTISIECDKQQRIERIKARDKSTTEGAQKALANQATDDLRQQIADTVIMNDGSLEDFYNKLLQTHHEINELAAKK